MATSSDSSNGSSGETSEDYIWVQEFVDKFHPYNIDKTDKGLQMKLDCSYEDSCKLEHEMRCKYSNFNIEINRICDACGRNNIQNETVFCCIECDSQYDECVECHKNSTHHHPNSFKKQDPSDSDKNTSSKNVDSPSSGDDDKKSETRDLVIYGEELHRRLFEELPSSQKDPVDHLRLVDTVQMKPDVNPPMVKLFEWRDWFKRTDGVAEIYSSPIGGIYIKFPDFYVNLEKS